MAVAVVRARRGFRLPSLEGFGVEWKVVRTFFSDALEHWRRIESVRF